MSNKKEIKANIKAKIGPDEVKYIVEKIAQIHSRMQLAKQAFEWRNDIEEEHGYIHEADSPEELIVDLILEDLDKIFDKLGIDLPKVPSMDVRIKQMMPKDFDNTDPEDLDTLKKALRETGLDLIDFIEDGKECPN
tara:strand:+ start:6241 stop:6648 length:408 start_codon:yes stop_codon:yes gene_type:complete